MDKRSLVRALGACILAAGAASPALAADLTGKTVDIDWGFPTTSDIFASDSVVVGAGPEVVCAGGGAGSGLCTGFIDAAHLDIGADTLSLTIDQGSAAWTGAAFNGYEFTGLAAGGSWTGYSLSTDFSGLDSSRITFTPDAVFVNMQGIAPAAGQSFTITLQAAAVPEPANAAMLLAGVAALGGLVRRQQARRR
ncbi:MAG TPA: PEP-CTERM sorting domain-containing protein [Burkholderiaceae bacterium]